MREQSRSILSSCLPAGRRAFVKLRKILSTHKELAHKLIELERKIEKHDGEIEAIFEAIRQLMAEPERPKNKIGFHVYE